MRQRCQHILRWSCLLDTMLTELDRDELRRQAFALSLSETRVSRACRCEPIRRERIHEVPPWSWSEPQVHGPNCGSTKTRTPRIIYGIK